jgi:Winged helix-turn helix
MRFEEAFSDWQAGRLTQQEAARLLGVCERSFRRYVDRYEAGGLEGLMDKRISQLSQRRAPVDEVMRLVDLYQSRYAGWNVCHFHRWYARAHAGARSYSWVKNTLQAARAVARAKGRGKHRKRRERAPLPGMIVHQDGSTHEWVAGVRWDLIVTMDDATGEHLSMFLVPEEGTASSFHGLGQTIAAKGLFAMLYTDRGSHYFLTPEAGGKVDKHQLTQVGRALAQLGIHHQGAYSPQARGRSERAFGTHQERLPRELALAGIRDMAQANRYLELVYRLAYNAEFAVPPAEPGSAFVPYIGPKLADILCEQHERTVGKDNCVSFAALKLQIPADRYRHHYVKAKVRVHRYVDASLAIFHGPRKLADYDARGALRLEPLKQAA